MTRTLLAALCLTMTLTACSRIGNSRLNPFNWFGGSQEAAQAADPVGLPVDKRLLVATVTELALERMPGGVIIRATGLPPTQGYWDAELVARPLEDGRLVYDFRIFPPITDQAVSTPVSREVTVATFLSDAKLANINEIAVQGASNARASRR